jgi:hypothetical protein
MPMFCSNQFNSYSHTHAAGTLWTPNVHYESDGRVQGELWSMREMFTWARDQLHLRYVMWEMDLAGTQQFTPDGTDVIAAYPTFNTTL